MAYSTKGILRVGNIFQSTWRDPKNDNKVRKAHWPSLALSATGPMIL